MTAILWFKLPFLELSVILYNYYLVVIDTTEQLKAYIIILKKSFYSSTLGLWFCIQFFCI